MITFLHVVLFCLKTIFVLTITLLILIGIDLAYYESKGYKREDRKQKVEAKAKLHVQTLMEEAKARIRKQKEEEAWEGFFETHYIRGFENNGALRHYGARIPTRKAFTFFKLMDELTDEVIFDNTKEL